MEPNEAPKGLGGMSGAEGTVRKSKVASVAGTERARGREQGIDEVTGVGRLTRTVCRSCNHRLQLLL